VKSIESQGRTIEEALDLGLKELQLSIGDVTWTPLQEGSKGLFGLFGSRPARVRITAKDDSEDDSFAEDVFSGLVSTFQRISDSAEQTVDVPQPRVIRTEPKEPLGAVKESRPHTLRPEPREPQNVVKEFRPHTPKPNAGAPESIRQPAPRPEFSPNPDGDEPVERRPYQSSRNNSSRQDGFRDGFRKSGDHRPSAGYDRNGKDDRRKFVNHSERYERSERAERVLEAVPVPAEPPVIYPASEPAGRAQYYVSELIRLMGVSAKVYASVEEGYIRIKIYGDTNGVLIGRRGETLDALQYLTALYVNKEVSENHERGQYIRVSVDTENYRARREESLKRLAFRLAERAVRFGRRVPLEPMNPYERRVIHASLQEYKGVTTYSEGEEPNRFVVITPKR